MIRGTNLFIYLLEDYGNLSAAVAELRTKMLQSGDQLLTSTFTFGRDSGQAHGNWGFGIGPKVRTSSHTLAVNDRRLQNKRIEGVQLIVPLDRVPLQRSLRQLLQNLFAQLLRLAKKFLILQKQTVQLQRLVSTELLSQHHVPDVHRVGQGGFFVEFFEGGVGIVVIHNFSDRCRARLRPLLVTLA